MLNDLQRRQLRVFWRNKVAVGGAAMTLVLVMTALCAQWLAPYDPTEQNVFYRLTPPELLHPFGTDDYGRDILSRVIWGSRISLAVGMGSVFLGMVVGSLLGMIAGFKGEKLGDLIMRSAGILLCFPAEILAIMVLVVLGQGLDKLILTIGIVMTPRFARLSYGSTLSLKEREYIEAARSIGAQSPHILLRYILLNILGEILVMSSLWTATAIRVESNLSFLGLGVAPPTPTWGNMVRAGVNQLTNAPWLPIFPGLAIMLAVLAFNLIGDGLRDVMDPKLHS